METNHVGSVYLRGPNVNKGVMHKRVECYALAYAQASALGSLQKN